MTLSKAAIHILETIHKGDHNKPIAKHPDTMADGGQCVASAFRAFRLYHHAPLPHEELTSSERSAFDNYYRLWDAATTRNTFCLQMPSTKELTDFIRENRNDKVHGMRCYVFPEGIAFNPHYLRDMHKVLGKVDILMWDKHPYHPATAQTSRGCALLLPCKIPR